MYKALLDKVQFAETDSFDALLQGLWRTFTGLLVAPLLERLLTTLKNVCPRLSLTKELSLSSQMDGLMYYTIEHPSMYFVKEIIRWNQYKFGEVVGVVT